MENTLDGFTILRFARAFRSGAGVETHLSDLDYNLLLRNNVTIIRLYIQQETINEKKIISKIGQGILIEIPMQVSAEEKPPVSFTRRIKQFKIPFLKIIFREVIIYNPFLYRVLFRRLLNKYAPQSGQFPIGNAGEIVRNILQEYKVDLVVMHHVGTVESAEIIKEAKKVNIPYIFHNCFSNSVLSDISVREQIYDAACIAGFSNVGVPRWLKDVFINVSSGVDTKLLNPDMARPIKIEIDIPIIFYPARINRAKGQIDILKVYLKLQKYKLRAKIVFAGRTDSNEYEIELKRFVQQNTLTKDVLFVGQLNRDELRDWYGISSIVALSTYHQEGLPTVLIEAQAMKVPPVAYIIGGTPEAIIDGKTGYLVKKGDIRTFTHKIRELLINNERRIKMGEAGRWFVEKEFSLKALAERHENLYLQALNKMQGM
jgi:glycosyltransferase involved in cell wall biosynthesis